MSLEDNILFKTRVRNNAIAIIPEMLIVLVLFLINRVQCARILCMFPTASLSHQIVFQPIWRELSLRGHQVLVFTPDPLKNSSLTNLTEIDMSSTYKLWREEDIAEKMAKENYAIGGVLWVFNKLQEIAEEHFKVLTKMPRNSSEFDLVIVETLHPLVFSLGCKFKVPIIGVTSFGLLFHAHDAVGNPTHPIIGIDMFANVMGEMGLYEKICSVAYNVLYRLVYYWYVLPKNDKIAKSYWGDDCPYLGTLERNVSLTLINTNPILYTVRPLVPNVIEMGQMHFRPKKPLPKELQLYLDSSPNGFIYVSFGTNVRSSKLSSTTMKIIVEALSELPYNFLWKLEEDTLPDKLENVLARNWFPQQDILRHPNIKAFVTQGGLQSSEETISNGVPIIGIPFLGDQPLNVMKMVKFGIGKSLNHVTMTKEELKETIVEVAENPKYREKVKELKTVFSDKPMTSLEKSIWWIEYVLRHNGARHLRCPAADLSWFEYYLVDVVAFLFVVLTVFVFLVKMSKKQILRLLNKRKVKTV